MNSLKLLTITTWLFFTRKRRKAVRKVDSRNSLAETRQMSRPEPLGRRSDKSEAVFPWFGAKQTVSLRYKLLIRNEELRSDRGRQLSALDNIQRKFPPPLRKSASQ